MRVLEVIQPNNDKQQLDEAIFTTLLIGALVSSLGAVAIEAGIGLIKNLADDFDIKGFKPTGQHIPDQTQITKGKQRFVYNAKEGKWGVQERSRLGKWKYKMIPGKDGAAGTFRTVDISAEDLKQAIKKKTLSFGNKAAVVDTMQRQFMEKQMKSGKVPAEVRAGFNKSGNFLDDVIKREEAGVRKGARGVWNRIKTGGAKIFSRRVFQAINIFMPVALVVNAVRLKAWYKTKLNWGKGEGVEPNPLATVDTGGVVGYPHPSGDPDKVYGRSEYDEDMMKLRTTTVNAAVAWMAAQGVNVLASGIFWLYAQRKGNIIDRVKKKEGLIGKSWAVTKWIGSAPFRVTGKIIKLGAAGVSAGLVYSAFDRAFAEKLANAMADFIFKYDVFSQTYSTAEDITEHMIKALGGDGYEQAMAQLGLGTTGGDKLANQDGKLGGEVNPLAKPPPGSSSNSALDAFNDLTNKDKDFWNLN
jgi:hypothetical protein